MNNVVKFPGTDIWGGSQRPAEQKLPGHERFFGRRESASEQEARLSRGGDAPGMVLADYSRFAPAPTVLEIQDAQRALAEIEAALEPLPEHELRNAVSDFFGMLNFGVANPQDDKALELREMALRLACADMPGCVWSQQTLAVALARFKFFPAVAEVLILLNEQAAAFRDRAVSLRTTANKTPRQETAKPAAPTEGEKQAVAERMAELRAEQMARDAEEDRIRQFGTYMPGDVTLRGPALIASLKADLPKMSSDLRDVTIQRIAFLERAQEMAAKVTTP